jgi:histidine triad (HIT) family protein
MECIFCKIVNKELPSEIVYEDDEILAFKDINPKAPVHVLIIPKKHIGSVNELKKEDKDLIGNLVLVAKNMAEKTEINKIGYKLCFNVGKGAGQMVDHVHLHLLGGWTESVPKHNI